MKGSIAHNICVNMVAIAPIPLNEEARLRALHSYAALDTMADDRFDLFSRLCTWIFHVPLASINLVDAERTYFKSTIGFQPYEPRRSTSICAHAVGCGDPILVVENLTNDIRFCDHPLVMRGMLFYAGALIYASSGHALGTLCVGDTRPRSFASDDRHKLIELANGVGSVLELHRSSLALRQIAEQDTLTELSNRRGMMDALQRAHEGSRSSKNYALLLLDLDGFKSVNDTYGHAAGDALLCEVGRRLRKISRTQDTIARIGGDEFAILVDGEVTISHAISLAQRILSSFAEPFSFEATSLPIRTSIGIVVINRAAPPRDIATLMRWADAALYSAKRAGKSQFALHPQ